MVQFSERRKYQRCESAICKTLLSTDSAHWNNIELTDISAGGLRFTSEKLIDEGTDLYFDIHVYNMLSEFTMKFEGKVVRKEERGSKYIYAIQFVNVNRYTVIQLDEIIKSKVSVKNSFEPITEDGIYTFLFLPRVRSRRMRLYL